MKKIFQNYLSSSNPIFQNKAISQATLYRNQNVQGCMKECVDIFNCNQIDMRIREMAANFIANSIKANNQQGQLLWSYISSPLKQSILICVLGVIANGSCSGYGIIEQIKCSSIKNKDQIGQIIRNRLYISFGELSQQQDRKRIENLRQINEITNTLMQYVADQKDIVLYLETIIKIICQSEHKQQIQQSCQIVKNIYKQFNMGYNFNIFSISDSLLDKLLHLLIYNKYANLDFIAQAIVEILEVLSASPLLYKYLLKIIDILKQYPKFGTIQSEDKSLKILIMLLSIIMGIMHHRFEQINICQQIYKNVVMKFCYNQHGFNVDAFHILGYMTLYLKQDKQAAFMVWEAINRSLDKFDDFQLFRSIMSFLQFLYGDLPSQYPKIQKQILSKILILLQSPNFNVQYHSYALKGIGAGLINRVYKEENKKFMQILLLICSSAIDAIYGKDAEDMKDSIIESITTLVMIDDKNQEMRSIVHNAVPQFVQFVLQQITGTSKQNYSFVNQCCSFLADLIIAYPQSITKYNKDILLALKYGLTLLKQQPQKYKNNIEYIEKAQQRLI